MRVSFLENNHYDPVTGCWNWTGHLANGRYGEMKYMGEDHLVHRLSAHFYLGYDLNSDLRVLHHCDNTRCFNPKHLFIGTQLQNMQDMVRKGRHARSEQTHCHLGHELTEDNTYFHRGTRNCRECHREAQRRYVCKG